MQKERLIRIVVALMAFGAFSFAAMAAEDAKKEEKSDKVALKDVPEVVLKAAKDAVPGGTVKEAEMDDESKDGGYELKVTDAKGVVQEVKISKAGKVVSMEKDDEGDEKGEHKDGEKKATEKKAVEKKDK